jgi:hypothetical protein
VGTSNCHRHTVNREFKLRVSGKGKRQIRTFFAKFPLNVFVSYFLSCVKTIVMHCSFKTASSFTLYCLIPYNFSLPGVCRLPYNAKLKLCNRTGSTSRDKIHPFPSLQNSHNIQGTTTRAIGILPVCYWHNPDNPRTFKSVCVKCHST